MKNKLFSLKQFSLQFISHFNQKYSYLDSITIALKGGCTWIQLRVKEDCIDELIRCFNKDELNFIEINYSNLLELLALKVQKLCKDYNAIFLIDDNVDLVKKIQADGVHLGKNDMPILQARKLLGDGFIIGGTANTYDDLLVHYNSGANYIGMGPYKFTTTKTNLSPILGNQGYRAAISNQSRDNIYIPIVAIGGITYSDISDILDTGVSGIALSGGILKSDEPILECKKIINECNKYNIWIN